MRRRSLLTGVAAGGVLAGLPGIARRARAEEPGVTATEIKIGSTNALSGPASAYGVISRTNAAYFNMVNDQGGIGGRKINFIFYDDGYAPPRTVEQTRRLVEQDGVAFMFNALGTATNNAVQRYLNQKKIPQLFLATGADRWGDYQHFPWTMGFQPSYRIEAQIYAKTILRDQPKGKVAVLYQNDDFGKDYLSGLKDVWGDKYDSMVVKAASYEVTDPTIDSQVVTLQSSGADILVTAATPKFAAQTIRKVADIGWKPVHYLTNVSISVGSVMKPAGAEKGVGIVTSGYIKDSGDARWKDDPGMNEWRAFMAKYMPDTPLSDGNAVYGFAAAATMTQVLKQCGAEVTRERVMHEAANLHDFEVGVLVPGIRINTSPTNFHPLRQMQLARWTGEHWEGFGDLIEGSGA